MTNERGPWYLLTGLIIGLALGLLYAWVWQPVEYTDTSPASLRSEFKDQYRALIASAYVANGDLVRARARLALLEDDDAYRSLAEQAQRTLAEDNMGSEARALGLLALSLGQGGPGPAVAITKAPPTLTASASATNSATPSLSPTASLTRPPTHTLTPSLTPETPLPTETLTPSPTLTRRMRWSPTPTRTPIPRPTFTPTRTRTPSPTPGGPFALLSREKICDQKLSEPLLQVEALNAFSQPTPGILVIITWEGGEEHFYTGLIPEKGPGYADFTLQPGTAYKLRLGDGGEVVSELSAADCETTGGERFWGSWLLTFIQL